MANELGAYKIGGSNAKVLKESTGYLTSQLNGNPPFVFADPLSVDYASINNIVDLSNWGQQAGKDYLYVRKEMRNALDALTWAATSDAEKDALLENNLYNKRRTITFVGAGIDDLMARGKYSGAADATFEVIIDAVGATDTFKWRKDGGAFTNGVAITGGKQTLQDNIKVKFHTITGHTLNNQWDIGCLNTDADADKVGYLMAVKGMTQPQAEAFLQLKFAEHHIRSIAVCATRSNVLENYEAIAKYLELRDAVLFFRLVRELFIDYTDQSIIGSRAGDRSVGIADFIQSTGLYYNSGLTEQGYVVKTGTIDDLITILIDVLVNGDYNIS